MLSRLTITNYALIEHLDFEPGEGLSIITGETGAGKSIMMGALSLLRGERADLRVIGDKAKKAIVEALFMGLDKETAAKILEIDNEWDGNELIIRREILPSGRSRAFLNDSPATLQQLADIASGLMDIHSQNSNSMLSGQRMQLELLDSIACNEKLLSEYSQQFSKYVSLRQEIKRRIETAQKVREQSEIIAFRLGMLDKLRPKVGELKKIEARHEALSNSAELRAALMAARMALDGAEMRDGALEQIDEAREALGDVDFELWEEQNPMVQERLSQCAIEIKDIVETIDSAIGSMDIDPSSLEILSKRMNSYYSALSYFKVSDDSELVKLHEETREQARLLEGEDADTGRLEKEAKETAKILKGLAEKITSGRIIAAASLKDEVESGARKLGLENIKFEIKIDPAKLSRTGGDRVEFMASFNKNGAMAPVGEMASGGEMARLMLVIKKISATRLKLPTIIFDEIDTGVGGGIADRMGEMMKQMGEIMQIITITHLPQVAVKGKRHFKVYKEDRGTRTVSDIMQLTANAREEEIGRMLAGEEIDAAALSNARSLLKKGK